MSGLTLYLALGAALVGVQNQSESIRAVVAPLDMIVFRSDRDAIDGELYRMDHRGGRVQRLTMARGTERSVAVNAQGTQIAFFRETPFGLGTRGLYTMRSDGTGERLLLAMTDCGSVAFSPDGTRLAFINVDYAIGPTNEIYFIGSDGKRLNRFTDRSYANNLGLAWSRDGTALAYMRYQPTPGIYYVPAVGGPSVSVVAGEEPSFSHRGDRLIYSRSTNGFKRIYWTDLQGRGEHQITEGFNMGRAVFDVDGTSILFTAYQPKQQIFLMDANQRTVNLSSNHFSDSDPVIAGS